MVRWRKRVEAFLYRIPRIQLAVKNIEEAIQELDEKIDAPPLSATDFKEKVNVHSEEDRMANRVANKIANEERREFLRKELARKQNKLDKFNSVMSLLVSENPNYAKIIEKKYIFKVKPDSIIYDIHIYTSKRTYYRMLDYALRSFYECMPEEFGNLLAPITNKEDLQ